MEIKEITKDTEIRLSFNYEIIYKALKDYIDRYNAAHPGLKEKLNAGHRATAELIIRLYLKQLNKTAQVVPYSLANMPGFRTYVSSLATCKGCTPRTILNHRERLIKASLITAENHRGRDGLDLWINPKILWKGVYAVQNLPEGGVQMTPIYDIIMANRKKVQPLVTEQQEQDNINSNVDNKGVSQSADESGLPKGEAEKTGAFDKSTRKNADTLDAKQAKEAVDNALNACFSKKNEVDPITEPEKMPQPSPKDEKQEQQAGGAARIFLHALVVEFWEYAKNMLYKEVQFKPYEESSILNQIYVSVYGRFRANKSKEGWEKYQETLIERVDIVRHWLDRSPDRWIPSADYYFSPGNHKNGFDKNRIWYEKQELMKLRNRNHARLRKMKKELELYGQGKGEYAHKTRLQLFMIHKRQLDRINDSTITAAYETAFRISQNLTLQKHA